MPESVQSCFELSIHLSVFFFPRTIKAPFTLQEIFGTARIKMVHVPKTIALMSCLHVFFSAVLSGVRKCFGTGKRLNILGSVRDYSLGRMRLMASFIQTWRVRSIWSVYF